MLRGRGVSRPRYIVKLRCKLCKNMSTDTIESVSQYRYFDRMTNDKQSCALRVWARFSSFCARKHSKKESLARSRHCVPRQVDVIADILNPPCEIIAKMKRLSARLNLYRIDRCFYEKYNNVVILRFKISQETSCLRILVLNLAQQTHFPNRNQLLVKLQNVMP